MQRAYTPEWRPKPPTLDQQLCSPSVVASAGARSSRKRSENAESGGKAEDAEDAEEGDDGEEEEAEEEEEEEEGPLPVCTSDDELEFAAIGAPTEEKPHMFRRLLPLERTNYQLAPQAHNPPPGRRCSQGHSGLGALGLNVHP